MRYLIDTHVLLWELLDDPRLSSSHRAALNDVAKPIFVSDVSLVEIAIKIRTGKLRVTVNAVVGWIERQRFDRLTLKRSHIAQAADLPRHHGDPFDALLIAQAKVEGMTLLSGDSAFALYDVTLI